MGLGLVGCEQPTLREPRGVLVTRPEAEARVTAERVRALGLEPVLAPLLMVETVVIGVTSGFDGVVLTSGNALAGVLGFVGLPLLAVGDATAGRARALGFQHVVSAAGDAAALAAVAPAHFPPGARLLFATTETEGAVLTEALRGAGFRVERRVAYTVRPVTALPPPAREALEAGRLRAALFLSARTARTFAAVLDPALHPCLAGVEALAIGQPAADELTLLPWRRVRVSLGPTLDQVLALL